MRDSIVKAKPLWEQIGKKIITDIQNGDLKGGDKIVEAELARRLETSRNPIREACRQLQQKDILEYRPNIGNIVKIFSFEEVSLIIDTRIFLEQKAVELIRSHRNQDNLRELAEIVGRMSELKTQLKLYQMDGLDYTFHYQLILASDNNALINLWNTIDPYTKIFMYFIYNSGREIYVDGESEYRKHRQLLSLLQLPSGEVEEKEIGDAFHNHIKDAFTNFLRLNT